MDVRVRVRVCKRAGVRSRLGAGLQAGAPRGAGEVAGPEPPSAVAPSLPGPGEREEHLCY